jgi:predicted ribosome quality control (RQC) complex YloA/Tae2 family protein
MDGLAIAASLVEVRRAAEGALVRSIHEPEPGVFLVRVYGTGAHAILLSPRTASLHVTRRSFRNPERPSSFVMQLRKHLRGGRIRSVQQQGWERTVSVDVVRQEGGDRCESTLTAELTGLRGNLLLIANGVVIGSLRKDPRNPVGHPYTPLASQGKTDPRSLSIDDLRRLVPSDSPARALAGGVDGVGRQTAEDLVALAGESLCEEEWPASLAGALLTVLSCLANPKPHADRERRRATFYAPPDQAEAVTSFGEALDLCASGQSAGAAADSQPQRERIQRAIGRHMRTARSLRQWLLGADDAQELRRRADFLMLHAADLGRGTTAAAGEDLAGGERLAFAVSPRRNGIENAQDFYRKARKLDRGRPRVSARLRRIETELARWQAMLEDLDSGRDVDVATQDTRVPRAPRKLVPAVSLPRRFDIDGYVILVGRSAAQNDDLMRQARPRDLWLHARDVPGSHVVVRRDGEGEIPSRVVQEAARLAARYSKADRRGRVAVVCAEARHVRRPRRGPPGLAIVTNDSTLTVELEETQ